MRVNGDLAGSASCVVRFRPRAEAGQHKANMAVRPPRYLSFLSWPGQAWPDGDVVCILAIRYRSQHCFNAFRVHKCLCAHIERSPRGEIPSACTPFDAEGNAAGDGSTGHDMPSAPMYAQCPHRHVGRPPPHVHLLMSASGLAKSLTGISRVL